MSVPTNLLQNVQTYQMSDLAFLLNYSFFINKANKKFDGFESKVMNNSGNSVAFDLPPRYTTMPGLVVGQFQSSTQRIDTLTVDKSAHVPLAFTAQQMIFNVEEYEKRFKSSAAMELATFIESDVANVCENAPYRFYDGVTNPLSSYTQLAKMLQVFRTYGCPQQGVEVVLSDAIIPGIIGSGLNQFVPNRNEDISYSWMLGDFDRATFSQSNLLPIHYAGNVGKNGDVLTVVSTNDPTGNNITEITFSGTSASDANAIKKYDLFELQLNVAGQRNLSYLTFIGHRVSSAPVQFAAVSDAASDGAGNVTISITPALCATNGNPNQNLPFNLQPGMQVTSLPDHRCGAIISGDALFLAMPKLPDQHPYATSNYSDPETGASIRFTAGSQFGQNTTGTILDSIWGKKLVPEYSMRIALPLY